MTAATAFQVLGFMGVLAGVTALAGWPWAAILGGALAFYCGGLAAARQGGRR